MEPTQWWGDSGTGVGELFGISAERSGVPGAQLAVHTDGGTVSVPYGLVEHTGGDKVGPGTMFPLGSATKSFTATVAMQLVADGDVELDVPMADHMPELARARSRALREITLRQALSHTGGLVSDYEATDVVSLRGYVRALLDRPDVWVPGSGFSYSNTGYVLVGSLIEELTGLSWWEAVESFVVEPLGLRVARLDASGMAVPHVLTNPVDVDLPAGWEPAGGLAATAESLVEFVLAHLDGRVLPDEYARLMREPVAAKPFGIADGWGLGWATHGSWFGHDGTLAGTSCSIRAHAESRTVVALVTNGSTGLDLWTELAGAWGIGSYAPPSVDECPVDASELLGEYFNDSTCFTVREQSDGLELTDGTGFTAAFAVGDDDLFKLVDSAGTGFAHVGRFLRDDAGRVAALQFSGRIARRVRS
ncbi:serine hydrolase domain-containing protein [Kibdelosporangium aridum]|uniref:CubicO group peptidase, beta-lactamase class C family n=1 Tax=Kibdelosporangium aridum TaxID=2030 RepID=A0A1W2AVM4_KIBAR|nr:serine hydrolase domain-containing protein [Kibdelosporangium aridum]SMC64248.1 CubicO group peptidase, beta-lactamase class C family [Kibdelosporangium aridum]